MDIDNDRDIIIELLDLELKMKLLDVPIVEILMVTF